MGKGKSFGESWVWYYNGVLKCFDNVFRMDFPLNSIIYHLAGVYSVRLQVPTVYGYEGVGEAHSISTAVKDL